MDVSKLENVFYNNFSLITVSDNKVPNFPWKSAQTKKTDWNQFLKQFNYKGGIKRADGVEIPSTDNFGIVTGFEDLETIDVDLKVLSTPNFCCFNKIIRKQPPLYQKTPQKSIL